jgi:glycine cleavage system H protein
MSTIHYTESHEWLLEQDGLVTIGITDHAQELLGEVVYVELPEIDREFDAGEELVVIESVKAAGGIEVPVAGQVVAVNDRLVDSPELVNDDPMGEAWIVRFKPETTLDEELFMTEEQYRQSIEDQ